MDEEIDRELIDASRDALGPSDAQKRRLRASVIATITAGASAVTTTAASAASGAATGGVGAVATWKVAAVVVGLATVGVSGGAAVWQYGGANEERPAAETRSPADAPERVAISTEAPASPDVPPEPDVVEAPRPLNELAPAPALPTSRVPDDPPEGRTDEPVPSGARRAVTRSPVTRSPVTRSPVTRSPVTRSPVTRSPATTAPGLDEPDTPSTLEALETELSVLRRAHAAAQSDDPARALALLEEHRRRFPDGSFGEERAATRVLALCALDREDAAAREGAAFLSAHPESIHAARVRACACVP